MTESERDSGRGKQEGALPGEEIHFGFCAVGVHPGVMTFCEIISFYQG